MFRFGGLADALSLKSAAGVKMQSAEAQALRGA